MIELAVVLAVIVILASVTAVALPAWREGAAKATCQTNMARVQQSMRAWSALNNRPVGATIAANGADFIGNDANTSLMPPPACTGGGSYTFLTTVPSTGTRFANCNITRHPDGQSTAGW